MPNCLKNCPAIPDMKLAGAKMAMMRQADRDHGEADFVGSLQCRAIGRFAHPHVAHDILDLDDSIVH